MGHGLAQLGLLVRMVDQVGLVDDVDQMARFGDAPEHPVDAEAQFPFAAAQRAAQQQIGFAQIAMGAGRVGGVGAEERRQGEAGRPGDLEIEFRLGDQPGVIAALAVPWAAVCGNQRLSTATRPESSCWAAAVCAPTTARSKAASRTARPQTGC